MAVDGHRIAGSQLATAPGLDRAVHAHVATLNALLGLAAGADEALPFEELIQLQRQGTPEER